MNANIRSLAPPDPSPRRGREFHLKLDFERRAFRAPVNTLSMQIVSAIDVMILDSSISDAHLSRVLF